MEDLLILIIQATVEVFFELFSYLPWDWWWYARPFDTEEEGRFSFGWWLFLSVIIGGVLGYFSVYVCPTVIVRFAWLRIALLFTSPLASGCIARHMAERRQKQGRISDPNAHFWLSFCFSLGLVWIRFAFAHRA